jgi:glycolate oxidase FAD binding subunit
MSTLRVATEKLLERLRPDRVPDGVVARFFVEPRSIDEAADLLSSLRSAGLTAGFLGAGTHQGIGGRTQPDVMILASGLDRIIDFEPDDLTLVAEAGVPVMELEALAAERGLTTVLPELPGTGTLGGAIATGLSGYRRLRYGPTRDRVLEVTMATGYGRVVRAGGRVVKNVTGYDVPRLAVGSLGSLGMIGSVALKLWPQPRAAATIPVADPVAAFRIAYRPLAVLDVDGAGAAFIAGTPEEITAEAELLGGEPAAGLLWPEPVSGEVRFSVSVPAGRLSLATEHVRALGASVSYRAQHGVGLIDVGVDRRHAAGLAGLRGVAEDLGGSLVLREGPDEVYEAIGAWGVPPASIELQRRVKAAFDPDGICNPGRLPGGL